MKYLKCLFCEATNHKDARYCGRCGQYIALDAKKSLHKSFAYLLSAVIFYIPANIYPVLLTSKFAYAQGSTILEGVMAMWQSGDYPVAIIIFIASIFIPLAKFAILLYLHFTLARCVTHNIRKRVLLYHLIELTGPWSLIDVFVVLILVALIHFKNIAIIPGIGVSSFALMVVLTILSANALDPRLLGVECAKR